jgi:hypothetical protein
MTEQLVAIDAAFRKHQHEYFDKAARMNWVACGAALALAGGLLYLLMFDTDGKRVFYLAILALAFIFMIGPALHLIPTWVVHMMGPPSLC